MPPSRCLILTLKSRSCSLQTIPKINTHRLIHTKPSHPTRPIVNPEHPNLNSDPPKSPLTFYYDHLTTRLPRPVTKSSPPQKWMASGSSIRYTVPFTTSSRCSSRPKLEPNSVSSGVLTPVFSEGEDSVRMEEALKDLVVGAAGTKKWRLVKDGKGIQRTIKFKTFKITMEFINAIAAQASRKEILHHPEWSNVYNTTTICWTTHKPEGLSSKDIALAKFTDETAAELGELL